MISVTISGQTDIAKTLAEISKATRSRIGVKALITALTPIVDDAKARAPKDTGNLSASIGFKVVKFRDGNLTAVIGPRKGFRRDGRLAHKYGHLVEFGHHTRGATGVSVATAKGTSTRRGTFKPNAFVLPQPFLRPAFQAHKQSATNDIARVLGQEVELTAKRMAKRRARKDAA